MFHVMSVFLSEFTVSIDVFQINRVSVPNQATTFLIKMNYVEE